MKLEIKHLNITNVKGIDKLNIDIQQRHFINGPNGVGKSTMLDTIMWIMTGQSDLRSKKFDPTVTGLPVDNETEAELTIAVDGVEHKLKMARPSQTAVMKYFIDGEKVKKADYQLAIAEMGIKKVELLMNPYYLLDTLTWQEARKELSSLINQPTEDEIRNILLSKAVEPQVIEHAISIKWNKQTALDDRTGTKANIDLLKANLRHEEAKLINLPSDEDTLLLETRKSILIKERKAIEDNERSAEIDEEIKNITISKTNAEAGINNYNNQTTAYTNNKTQNLAAYQAAEKQYKELLQEGNDIMARDVTGTCGTCGQSLGETTIEAMRAHIIEDANKVKANADKVKAQAETFRKAYSQAALELSEYISLNEELTKQQTILKYSTEETITKLLAEKSQLMDTDTITKIDNELIQINKQLATESKFVNEAIKSLETQLEDRRVHLSVIEATLTAISLRLSTTAENVKAQLKDVFPGIEIILEKTMKSGEVKPDFTVSINGVVYKDLNTAGQFRAATIIALGLQTRLGLSVPILVDNAEGITADTWNATVPETQLMISAAVQG